MPSWVFTNASVDMGHHFGEALIAAIVHGLTG
jgi:hypothetical protein